MLLIQQSRVFFFFFKFLNINSPKSLVTCLFFFFCLFDSLCNNVATSRERHPKCPGGLGYRCPPASFSYDNANQVQGFSPTTRNKQTKKDKHINKTDAIWRGDHNIHGILSKKQIKCYCFIYIYIYLFSLLCFNIIQPWETKYVCGRNAWITLFNWCHLVTVEILYVLMILFNKSINWIAAYGTRFIMHAVKVTRVFISAAYLKYDNKNNLV